MCNELGASQRLLHAHERARDALHGTSTVQGALRPRQHGTGPVGNVQPRPQGSWDPQLEVLIQG
jgi:hypothetical protein